MSTRGARMLAAGFLTSLSQPAVTQLDGQGG